jgi:hypothetical protein
MAQHPKAVAWRRRRQLSLKNKNAHVVELAIKGWTNAAISRETGISQVHVGRILALEVSKPVPGTEELIRIREERRRMENMKLDARERSLHEDKERTEDIDQRVKLDARIHAIAERRARLNGLDMPVKHEMSGPNGGPIPNLNIDVSKLTDEQLEQIARTGLVSSAEGAS